MADRSPTEEGTVTPARDAPMQVEDAGNNPVFRMFIDAIQSGSWASKPLALQTLGIQPERWLKRVAPGRLVYEWPNDGAHDIQPGRVFGGWVGALSDHVVSMCMFSALEEGEDFTTQDLQIKLFRPVSGGVIRIEAEVVNRSRSTGYVEARWLLENGKLAVKVLAWKAIRKPETLAPRA
ncbi:MAG: PaaI family thioesterase [Pseudomonadota bacterium]